jgi:small subunit ribosomal protein S2
VSTLAIKHAAGTLKWIATSSQKETEFTLLTCKKRSKKSKQRTSFVRDLAADGGKILFVGTKKQAQDSVRDEAIRCGMFSLTNAGLAERLQTLRRFKSGISA